jgi:predicted O-linked N-acetylglucosamine transferase (SPINDLY family)
VASFDSALAIDPAFPDAWRNRGHTLRDLGRHPAAVDSYARALHVNADDVAALASRGHLLHYLGRNDEAARDFARVVALSPHSPYAWSMLSMLHRHNCDWDAADAAFARVREALANGAAVEPFPFLVQSASAADQKRCAELAVASAVPSSASPLWHGERYEHAKIRVAYLSADFREHATAYLIADVLERHDRSRFEVTAVSWCAEEATATRERLKRAVDTFVDVQAWTDEEVARWLRERRIDIVVDLMGFANGARPGICARRPAPVQVNFLGYPGTMGAPYLDYIVADTTLIAPDAHRDFTERVVCMPDSYQPNDRERPIAPDTPSREACGLPESGFVFCSFNSTYKITPAMFDVWMRLLARVEGSVLWLLAGTATSAANLRREAASRGVAPQRLVFAPRLALAAHLARQRNAQLFLDTLPCNAHTTASDALWVGLPVVTCLGTTFAGRVAGSLLRAAGLPELVAESVGEYEALVLRLATHDDELATVREKLTRNRMSCALFDSDRYRGHLESAFATMTERARAGLPPAPFAAA